MQLLLGLRRDPRHLRSKRFLGTMKALLSLPSHLTSPRFAPWKVHCTSSTEFLFRQAPATNGADKPNRLHFVQSRALLTFELLRQVKAAEKRKVEAIPSHRQFSATAYGTQHFGSGPHLYVASPDALEIDQVSDYFSLWGRVLDVYFPAGSKTRHGSCCFVTLESYHSAHQAWAQAARRIGSQVTLPY